MTDRHALTADDLRSINDLFERLSTLTKNFQIYGIDHPRTQELITGYQALAARVRRIPNIGKELVIPFHDGRFYLEHVPLSVQRNQGQILFSHLERNQCGGRGGDIGVTRLGYCNAADRNREQRSDEEKGRVLLKDSVFRENGHRPLLHSAGMAAAFAGAFSRP